ncbi:MAG: oxygenase MpaB family protein, partial [Solirubrobacteraceae bacterium]
YHALEPEAYAWVHLTLGEGMIKAHRHLGRRLSPAQEDQLWRDWRKAGRLLGIRDRDLPESWAEAEVLRDRMITERLGHNRAVDQVMTLLRGPKPPSPRIPGPLWRLISRPAGEVMLIVTGGLMDPDLRSRLGIPWGPARQRAFGAIGLLGRAASLPMMLTPPLRAAGPWYLWARGRATRSKAVDRVALDIETPPEKRS